MKLVDLNPMIYAVNRDAPHHTDAHLATLDIEHGATLCSTDINVARFQMLQWVNPLTLG